ncbi:50S ribosomal protein L10 [Candidatus Saccharibacteria bacterium]|nr:50S ribosomal protein L10 [Candidatus Saccharibacteria bacterium]
MAISKDKKREVVAQVETLLKNSKMTVIAKYQGTPVKAMQSLRTQARDSDTELKVIKNRLFKQALSANETLKDVEMGQLLRGQLIYAFNSHDEVAPAQNLAQFARSNPHIEFVAALNAEGNLLSVEEVKQLASLPTKDQLRAQLVATISAPASGFVNVLSGNLRGFFNILSAKAESNG